MSRNNKQRLELTWIGKGQEPKLEPRILIEDTEKSYGDKQTENILIHGDNLLALKALEQDFAGRTKCIYIDIPFNTGQAFAQYDDGVEHSIWLNLMKDRVKILHRLLKRDGSIWIHCDDNEGHYLKVVLDEIFGRRNFLTTFIWQKVDSPNDNKVAVTPDHEYIFCYAKNKEEINFKQKPDESLLNAYRGPDEKGRYYRDRLLKKNGKNSLRTDRPSMFFAVPDPDGNEVFPIHDDGREARWAAGKTKVFELLEKGEIIWKKRDSGWVPYTREFAPPNPSRPYPTIWTDVKTSRQAKAHQKQIFKGIKEFETPKPEELIHRIISICTNENDLVLDSFLGSGTTTAVAHKMNRKWIGIELGDHANTHCLPRMKKVVDGLDDGGITKSVNWKGGGGFKFYNLAPSLLQKDDFGNWIIDKSYNPDMLAAAMAKHEGYDYAPSEQLFWKQGQSTEQDFIFTTTQFVTVQLLDKIHEQMQDNESLLICCKSFQEVCDGKYPNINIKKIPVMLLGRCEFGKDDYSLNIISMPVDEEEEPFVPAARKIEQEKQEELMNQPGAQKKLFD